MLSGHIPLSWVSLAHLIESEHEGSGHLSEPAWEAVSTSLHICVPCCNFRFQPVCFRQSVCKQPVGTNRPPLL